MLDEAKITNVHNTAIRLMHEARMADNPNERRRLYREAYTNEREAAEALRDHLELEPTRSILFKGAGFLALECGEYLEAEKLLAAGLLGNPPAAIATEIRNLMDKARFDMHLNLQGLSLAEGDFRVAFTGAGISHGIASESFLSRVKALQALLGRFLRHFGFKEQTVFYWEAIEPASLSVSIRVAQAQRTLAGFEASGPVSRAIEGVIEVVDNFERGDLDTDTSKKYGEAFMREARQLIDQVAPDGQEISAVMLGTIHDGQELKAQLTRRATLDEEPIVDYSTLAEEIAGKRRIEGRLLYANQIQKRPKISLLADDGSKYEIYVGDVSLDDIVRPLWNRRVTARVVRATPSTKIPTLLEIFEARQP
jgi:hypothetical protein